MGYSLPFRAKSEGLSAARVFAVRIAILIPPLGVLTLVRPLATDMTDHRGESFRLRRLGNSKFGRVMLWGPILIHDAVPYPDIAAIITDAICPVSMRTERKITNL